MERQENKSGAAHINAQGSSRAVDGVNIFFTMKTTPSYYDPRIRVLHKTWFQKVDQRMVCMFAKCKGVAKTHACMSRGVPTLAEILCTNQFDVSDFLSPRK